MFPLKKKQIYITTSETDCLKDYQQQSEIPLAPHPGSFAKRRKNHIHEGIDLYAEKGDEVFAIEDGVIIKIKQFTGNEVQSPWWNDTWCVMVEGKSGVFNYGEIIPNKNLYEGMLLKEGDVVGNIETILKKDKGRPMNMLHLELYTSGTTNSILGWSLDQEKPENLLDPTFKLLELAKITIIQHKRKLI